MTPEFYLKIAPQAAQFKYLYRALTEQPDGTRNGRLLAEVYFPADSLEQAKSGLNSWLSLTRGRDCVTIKSVIKIGETKSICPSQISVPSTTLQSESTSQSTVIVKTRKKSKS